MGEIFLARQRGVAGFDRLAILKSLLPEMAQEDASLAAFLDEARVAAHLNHPNVVAIYEVDHWEGVYYIAMEYIAGIDLSRLAKMAKKDAVAIPPGIVAAIFRDACRGLGYAHSAVDARGAPLHLVHRDATPHNIMVRLDGMAKVVDFGIAQAANRSVRTSTGVMKGKLPYMAPEQVRSEGVSARSDQWSLGASLWELLTGRRLIAQTEPMEVLNLHLQGGFLPPSSVVESTPPVLDAIVSRMIASDPQARFSSCVEVADRLDDFVRAEGISQSDVANFVGAIAGPTIEAMVADLTPQRILTPGSSFESPLVAALDAVTTQRNVLTQRMAAPPQPLDSKTASLVPRPSSFSVAPKFCSQCATPLSVEARFCIKCGAPASGTMGPAVAHHVVAAPSSPQRMGLPTVVTPGPMPGIDLGQLGLAAAADLVRAMAAEKRTVCAVRASVTGALAPAEFPELALERAQLLVTEFVATLSAGGALIESCTIDAIAFAVGSETTSTEDATTAIEMAVSLSDVVRRFSAVSGVTLGFRAAVDSGPAIVQQTPTGRRVTGTPRDRAQRIERRVGGARILASLEAARLARRDWEFAAPFTVHDDGLSLEVAQVVGRARQALRSRLFVGRDRELEEVLAALKVRPTQTMVIGDAGAGRTAFLDEVLRHPAPSLGVVLRCHGRRGAAPYAAARMLIFQNADDISTRLQQLALPAPVIHRLLRLFTGKAVAPPAADVATAMVLDELAVVAALELVAGGGGSGGVIVVDDWGSVDAASRAALSLVGTRSAPIALLCTGAPGDPMLEAAARIVLSPLSTASIKAVVAHELGVDDVPAVLANHVATHAHGSPLLARLIVEDLVDQQIVTVYAGRVSVTPALGATPPATSVTRVYEARFDRLTDETRELLRAGAVLGDVFDVDVAGSMVGIDGKLRAAALLSPALQAGLIESEHSARFVFRLGLRQAVLARTTSTEQISLHERALLVLEQKVSEDDVAALEAIARHAEAARDDRRMVYWACRAAGAMDQRGARSEGVRWWRKALEVAGRLARQSGTRDDAINVVEIAVETMTSGLGLDPLAIAECWPRDVEPFLLSTPSETQAWALRAYGRVLVAAGRPKEAVAILDRALEMMSPDDDDSKALLLSELGGALEATGDIAGALVQMVEAFRRVQGRENRHAEFGFEALNRLGRLYLRTKATSKARDTFRLALTHASARGDESAVSRCEMNLGTCASLDGELSLGAQLFDSAAIRAERVGDVLQATRARLNLGRLLASSEPARATTILENALTEAQRIGWRDGIALCRQALLTVRGAAKP
jgi:serine/threonine protein kinase/tetratricopeptide (TPR) repeat protein